MMIAMIITIIIIMKVIMEMIMITILMIARGPAGSASAARRGRAKAS